MFYGFYQNNSGGYFDVDDNLCHRLFIEADNEDEAIDKAEKLGCYWNGVEECKDCPCCGDRWDNFNTLVSLDKWAKEGYMVRV